ncbi:cardiolipin synthase [Fictibacillus nanhaiensis]|uniref:cardiolipin synthase n=1 Tax=Fictibacillus nanhaiensis TaxID=742169 RepID=UPI001C980CD0|nr:cardiolipin synthase [Fictibacillus nanhaiensis]MBY6037894.1 cardiolipin synthase [Fictibacillus nanhaiensis]
MKRIWEFFLTLLLLISLYIVFIADGYVIIKTAFGLLYVAVILYTIYSLMLENRTAQHTLLWIYVLILFPFIGYMFYLYSGQLYLKGHLFKSKRKNDRDEWIRVSKQDEKPDFSDLNRHQVCFAKHAHHITLTRINRFTSTKILKNGNETFPEIIKQLQAAKEYIHIQYYIFRSDRLGKEIIDILIQKASEGVKVRFLFDGIGSLSLQQHDIDRMKKAGILVEAFLPVRYGFFNQKLNFRNHRKIIVIDGKIGFVGGLNVGVEYLGEDPEIGFWRDTHLVMLGEAVQVLHAIFLLDWEYVCGEDLLEDPHLTTPIASNGDGTVHVVASGPDTQSGIMSDLYYSLISCAEKSIWIATPYFVPNEAIRTAMRVAAKKGVQVRLMVPEINDGFLTQYATRSYFPELLRSGIEIYSYKKGFMHQKVIIVDGDTASIGTANMDMRSFHLNFEVNVFLLNTSSVNDLVEQYKEDIEESAKLRPVEFYKRGLWERTKESFARLFSGVL